MNTKPKAIRKQDILEIVCFKYDGYERINHVPSKFQVRDVIAKLKDKNKRPNFQNILDDVNLIFFLEGNESLIGDVSWIEMKVVLKV